MKTNVLSLFALAGTLALTAACASEETTKQEQEQKQESGTEGLTAFVVEDNDTKTRTIGEYDGSGINFYWTDGDDLWVNNNTASPAVVSKNSTNNIGTLLAPKPANDKKTATAKFYFDGDFTAPSYTVRYTGNNSASGDKVNIATSQFQATANDGTHLGTDGDCGTALATKNGGKYNFTLDHKAAYLTFMPRTTQSVISGAIVTQIKVIADKAIAGEFTFNDNGIDTDSRPVTTPTNQMITLTLNTPAANTGFPIHVGSTPDYTKNGAVMVLAPGTYSTFTVEYTIIVGSPMKIGIITKTYSNFTLTAGKNRRVVTDLQLPDYSPWFNRTYQWDAKAPYWDGVTLPYVLENNTNYDSYGTRSANSNCSTAQYGHGVANNATNPLFATAPNANELYYYVRYGDPHYDPHTLWTYRGHLYTGGLWLKKQSVIYNDLKAAGYSQLTSQADMKERFYSSATDVTGADYRTTYLAEHNIPSTATLTNTTNYFFLPRTGSFYLGTLRDVEFFGCYWSSNTLPLMLNDAAYYMGFRDNYLYTGSIGRDLGFVVIPFE